MRTIFAEYNPQRNSVDVYTSASYMLRIDCSSLIKCVISFFLLCKLEKKIFQCVLLASHALQTNPVLNDGF